MFDLDAACVAEPALDVGGFLGPPRLVATRARHASRRCRSPSGAQGALERVFLGEYLRARAGLDREALLGIAGAYRTVTLAQVAVRSWCQLKPDRLGRRSHCCEEPHPANAPAPGP